MISDLRATTIFELYTSFEDTRSVGGVCVPCIYPYVRRELLQSILGLCGFAHVTFFRVLISCLCFLIMFFHSTNHSSWQLKHSISIDAVISLMG